MREVTTSEQFGRALISAFSVSATHEATMIEEEAEQIQVLRTDLTAEEEVVS